VSVPKVLGRDAKNELSCNKKEEFNFWDGRSDLVQLAKHLHQWQVFPHEYEMTVWVGAIEITIGGKQTVVEFLLNFRHDILDQIENPQRPYRPECAVQFGEDLAPTFTS